MTVKDLQLELSFPKKVLDLLPKDLYRRVDFGDLIASILAGGMAWLTQDPLPQHNSRQKYIILAYNEDPELSCYMTTMKSSKYKSLCGKLVYIDGWTIPSRTTKEPIRDIRDDEIFPFVVRDLLNYDNYPKQLKPTDVPFMMEEVDLIHLLFTALRHRIKQCNGIVTTFARYAMVYTEDCVNRPTIEIHH